MNIISNAAALLGQKGGKAGTGESKSRGTEKARAAAMARWRNPELLKQRFWEKVKIRKPDECWEWKSSRSKQGYGRFMHLGKLKNAHRVAYELTHGHIDPFKDCCHRCDNPPCCNPAHLFMGTTSENIQDAISKGRWYMPKGELHANSKLTANQVLEFRKHVKDGTKTMAQIAREIGVDHECVRMAVKGISWKHI